MNHDSLAPLRPTSFSPLLCHPNQNGYHFSLIPKTIKAALGMKEEGLPHHCLHPGVYDRVIFLFIDGFGWNIFSLYQDEFPFLKRMVQEGVVSKISSQFPSTTTAHITTLCTDTPVGVHALYEWFMYEPQVDEIVMPILYRFSRDHQERKLSDRLTPAQFFPKSTLFEDLDKQGITSHIYLNSFIANSIYSQAMYAGGQRVSCSDEQKMMHALKEDLKKPGFFLMYFGGFDSLAHRHGITSQEAAHALKSFFALLEQELMSTPQMQHASTALMISSDHGMIPIHPATTWYLNEKIPNISSFLQTDARGKVLAPSGSSRDLFLHVKEGYEDQVIDLLQNELKGVAAVLAVKELIKGNFFGTAPLSERFLQSIGNVVILPWGQTSIWWREKGQFEQKFYAMHGGLSREELEIPFIFYSKKR
ncbi:MAG: alkaline phosphatase family protein [Candidatus Rhabdochlamydia sp.]